MVAMEKMRAMERTEQRAASPFLAKTAQLRTGEGHIPGYYSDEMDMWVVETGNGPAPIITDGTLSQLLTKTRVSDEDDDDSPFALELMTKTSQQLESDDDRPLFESNQLLQLLTKTDTVSEQDDNFEPNHYLELITKTYAQQERDDDGSLSFGLEARFYKN